jgi:serine/threonine protein kinase
MRGVLRQVAGGLAHAHGKGLIHRNIKPENILVHERAAAVGYGTAGAVRITDFGLGKAASTLARESIMVSRSVGGAAAGGIAGYV